MTPVSTAKAVFLRTTSRFPPTAAMSPITTPSVLTRALCHADNCYFLPTLRFRGLACKTNTVSNTAFRGYGGPQGMLAIETVIEAVARKLRLQVVAVRRRNFYGIGRNDVTPYGMTVEDNIIEECGRRARPYRQPGGLASDIAHFNRGEPAVKKGLATMPIEVRHFLQSPGAQPGGSARPRLHRRQRRAQPWRNRDGAGPVRQGRTGGRRGVCHRSRQYSCLRHQHGKSAEHIGDSGFIGLRSQWHGGLACLRADQAAHDRSGRGAFCGGGGRDHLCVEPDLCRQSQPVVRRACSDVVRKARVAVGNRLLPHAQDPLGFCQQ